MISEAQAVQVIAYLVDCGAITARSDGQALVWADYLNHAGQSVQEVRQADLEAATRNLVTTWQNSREYAPRISPEALAREIRKIQAARLNAVENANPSGARINPPSDPQAYVTWEKTRRFLIGVKALPVEVAERQALKQAAQALKLSSPATHNTPPELSRNARNGLKPVNPIPARVSDFQPVKTAHAHADRQEVTTHH
jgi:hypothetical protein